MTNPKYLGDGVYVQQDEGRLVLTTGCHFDCAYQSPDNTIFLEPEVLAQLLNYIQTTKQQP